MTDIYNKFEHFEVKRSLFDFRIDNVDIWERIRFKIFRKVSEQSGAGQAHTLIEQNLTDNLKGGLMLIKNTVLRNPYLGNESDVVFIGHPRRKKINDGCWRDIYCDPVHKSCRFDYVHLEFPRLLNHKRPACTDNLRYLDVVKYGSKLQRVLRVRCPEISENMRRELINVQKAIRERFGADIDFVSLVQRELHVRNTRLWMYRRLLNRIDPEVAVIVVSYGKESFIEACQERNIPVVELQHGIIHSDHFGYSYAGSRTKNTFPDYLFVWGDFWKDSVEYPIPDERVIPVGYPYLEVTVQRYSDVPTRKQILFISQGTIGEQLSKLALEVHEHPDIEHDVVYKLHPGEYNRWADIYPWIVDAGIKIVDEPEPPLYRLFAESSAQIGVNSTAIFEGLCFGLETYVYDCENSHTPRPLIEQGVATEISSDNELSSVLGQDDVQFRREHFFEPDATENICEEVENII